ncbi:MAG: hypothetical protein EPO68_14955, partial [Planctomycetota bacterium]
MWSGKSVQLSTPPTRAREDLLRQHDVPQVRAVRHREQELAVGREVAAPRVRAVRRNDLDRAGVGAEAEDAVADPAEVAARGVRHVVRRVARVALRAVDPAVGPPAQIADRRVRVAVAEAAEQHALLVGDVVAVGVDEVQDLRRCGDDHSLLVQHERGDEVKALEERLARVVATVAVRVG